MKMKIMDTKYVCNGCKRETCNKLAISRILYFFQDFKSKIGTFLDFLTVLPKIGTCLYTMLLGSNSRTLGFDAAIWFFIGSRPKPPRPHCNWSFSSHASRSGIEFHSGRGEGRNQAGGSKKFLGIFDEKDCGEMIQIGATADFFRSFGCAKQTNF